MKYLKKENFVSLTKNWRWNKAVIGGRRAILEQA